MSDTWTPEPQTTGSWSVEVLGHVPRITETSPSEATAGHVRVTEQGDIRIIEFFAVTWTNESPSFTVWLPPMATAFDDNAFDPNAFE